MSKNSLILVLQNKQENSTVDMAKIVQTESRAQVYLNALQRCSLSYAKIVPTESRAQVYLNALQRCSLSYAKIQIKSEKLTPFGGIFSGCEAI